MLAMGRVGQCISDNTGGGAIFRESYQGRVDVHPALRQLTYRLGEWWFPIIAGWAQRKEYRNAPTLFTQTAPVYRTWRSTIQYPAYFTVSSFWCQAGSSEAEKTLGSFFP
jgi:hypothetical protein